MATDETVDGRSLAFKPDQNMLSLTSKRPFGDMGFWSAEKSSLCSGWAGKTPCCSKALLAKAMEGVSEAAVLGLVSIGYVPLKCGSNTEFCLRDASFFLRAKVSFIFDPRLRFRRMGCGEVGDLQPVHWAQSFSFVGKLCQVLHLSQSNSPLRSSGQDKRCWMTCKGAENVLWHLVMGQP
jgi:hypothetical protein